MLGMQSNRFSYVCYGLALAWVCLLPTVPWFLPEHDPDIHEFPLPAWFAVAIWLILTSPIPGALIGLGTGNLYGNRWGGAAIGFAIPAFILFGLALQLFH
jgi:hypothetical protein